MAQLYYTDGKVRAEATAHVWDSYTSIGVDIKGGDMTLFTLSLQVGEAMDLFDSLKSAIRSANPEVGFRA